MFYTYIQNNSHGFVVDDNVGHMVIVEADSPLQANELAKTKGVYFWGCANELDCPGCGDRWIAVAEDEPGTAEPTIYGETLADCPASNHRRSVCIVHYLDGRRERYEGRKGQMVRV
jgi:hypothetical protein